MKPRKPETRLFTSQHIIGAFSHWREPMLHLPAMVWLAGFYPQIGSGTLRLLRSCGCSGTEWSEAMTRPRFLSPNAVRHLRDRPSRPHAGLSSRRSARAGRAPRCNRGCSGLRPCAMEPRFRPGLAIEVDGRIRSGGHRPTATSARIPRLRSLVRRANRLERSATAHPKSRP